MPYINVDEAYILDNTGLQVDQVVDIPYTDAGLTETQQAQARKNIAAGGSNANLLDNPWFGSGEVINQRAATSGSTTVGPYFIDRWQTDYTGTGGASGTYSIGSTGITFSQTGTAFGGFRQTVATPLTDGTTYTISIKYADGTIETATRPLSLSANTYFINSDSVLVMRHASSGVWRFLFGGSVTIRAVKLELGSVSTLANDVPPDYGTELAKCQRYFVRMKGLYANFGVGFAGTNTTAYIFIPTPVTLREGAILSTSFSDIYAFALSAAAHTVTAITVQNAGRSYNSSGVTVAATTTNLNSGEVITLQDRTGSGYLDISADL